MSIEVPAGDSRMEYVIDLINRRFEPHGVLLAGPSCRVAGMFAHSSIASEMMTHFSNEESLVRSCFHFASAAHRVDDEATIDHLELNLDRELNDPFSLPP
ncbi:hypothetical protein EVAR_75838_1 [Eumeta japonica]|uniref:Uncharacterized protein n=1 Tax=Eumeta variegata TaxID=151549 RepID=A0A4C1TE89_EUMVA|nr:hypothetical protein EVAR_75838_1 [Eumeta japonica]